MHYQRRLPSPIDDHIDLDSNVPRMPIEEPASLEGGESSVVIRARHGDAPHLLEALPYQPREMF